VLKGHSSSQNPAQKERLYGRGGRYFVVIYKDLKQFLAKNKLAKKIAVPMKKIRRNELF